MRQRPAAARALRHHHLRPQPPQKPDRRIVDVGVQRLLRATRHQRHPHPPRAHGREHLRVIIPADRRNCLRRHRQHRPQARIRHKPRERPPHLRRQQRQPEPRGIGDHPRQHRPQQPVHQRPPVRPLDIGPRLVHQMHVMHARRTGRHAGKATQAPVDVLHRPRVRRPALLQHVLDQVDAPARAVQLIAQHLIGRASRRAEPAMHAGPQHLVRPGDPGVLQLLGGEGRLHQAAAPPFRIPRGSNRALSPASSAATSGASGGSAGLSPPPQPRGMAPPRQRRPDQRPLPLRTGQPDQPPAQSHSASCATPAAASAPGTASAAVGTQAMRHRRPPPRQRHDIPHPAPDRGTRRPLDHPPVAAQHPRSRPAR